MMEAFWNHWLSEHEKAGRESLGPLASATYRSNPKNLLFILSRYKFCAKMLEGKKHVLEVGCGDAIGVPIMLQGVDRITCVDMNKRIIEDDIRRFSNVKNVSFVCTTIGSSDLLEQINFKEAESGGESSNASSQPSPATILFDGAIACDVIEHIPQEHEEKFIEEIAKTLVPSGVCILGTPNITAFEYANEINKKEHINLQSHESLKKLCSKFFENVFLFSMNDEVVHTGFYPMAHYLWAVGVGRR